MRIIRSIKEMFEVSKEERLRGKTIGFVPTMGALHEGHLSLIRRARKQNDIIVVSIFVNPTQFGPKEDFRKYPRNLQQDALLCKREGVDIIFYPEAKIMYPDDYRTYVLVERLSDCLCGKFRPGHFKGAATVVTKLFNIVNPDIAYFGQKDAQQAIVIQKMVKDLNIPLSIKVMPTLREKSGLAMSSRNLYLSDEEKQRAVVLYQALNLAKSSIKNGNRDPRYIIKKMKQLIEMDNMAKIQYISIIDTEQLAPVKNIKGRVLIALAVWMGKTHLIDNIIVSC